MFFSISYCKSFGAVKTRNTSSNLKQMFKLWEVYFSELALESVHLQVCRWMLPCPPDSTCDKAFELYMSAE